MLIVCDICRTIQHQAEGPGVDQPICGMCLQACRVRAGILSPPVEAEVDLETIPFLAHVLFGAVPDWPQYEDFARAGDAVGQPGDGSHRAHVASVWHCEAVRWRLTHGGQPLDLQAIRAAVEARLAAESPLQEQRRVDAWARGFSRPAYLPAGRA